MIACTFIVTQNKGKSLQLKVVLTTACGCEEKKRVEYLTKTSDLYYNKEKIQRKKFMKTKKVKTIA